MDYLTLIELYYEKNYALRQGDITKLIELKNRCPDIFDAVKEKEIKQVIAYAKAFGKTAQYRALRRLRVRKSLSVIKK